MVQPGIEVGSLNRSSYPGQKCLGQCGSIFFNFLVPSKNSATEFSKNVWQVSLHPALNPTFFVGWGKGLGMCDFKEANKCKFVPRFCPIDCSLDAGKTTQPLN